jgi:hypothetical protein
MKNLLAIAVMSLLGSCAGIPSQQEPTGEAPAVQETKLDQASWILGEWQLESPEGMFVEKWQKETDTSYLGEGSLTGKNGEVLFSEKLRLEQRAGTLYYIPTIASQNDGKPVLFKEKSFAAGEIVFENPEHDFPQRIIYQKASDSTLYARVEGKQNGKDAKQEYSFKKKTP